MCDNVRVLWKCLSACVAVAFCGNPYGFQNETDAATALQQTPTSHGERSAYPAIPYSAIAHDSHSA